MKWMFSNNHIAVFILMVALGLSACSGKNSKLEHLVEEAAKTGESKSPKFDLNGVTYLGVDDPSAKTVAYLGVPFAQAPIKELRWREPQYLSIKASTFEAKTFAPACMQGPHLANWYKGVIESFGGNASLFETPKVSEDCLYLNIWAPKAALNGGKQLPVYVFIHGGSNKGGWSYEPNYVGETLANKGAIVVTIAYRLGVFGFFSHPELPQANFALLDQIAALEWVRNNIHLVGGDNKRITVAGESAGANNIAYLLASPKAKGLFQRVVFQSGGWALSQPETARQQALKVGEQFARIALNSRENRPPGQSALEALRGLSAEEVLATSTEAYADYFYDPVVDGHSVVEPLSQSMANSELAAVDIIVGSNADEQLMYLDENETIENWISDNLTKDQRPLVRNLLENRLHPRQILDDLATAHAYGCPALKLAESVVKSGGSAWAYYFSRVREGELASAMGAYHGAELPYIFNTHDDWLPTAREDNALTESIQDYWLNFMRNGNPNGVSLSEWPNFTAIGDKAIVLSEEVIASAYPSDDLCRIFWPSK